MALLIILKPAGKSVAPAILPKRTISRILFPIGFRSLIDFKSPESGGDHFSGPLIAQRLVRPTRETGDEPPLCASPKRGLSEEGPLACLALLLLGVAWPDTLLCRR
jgi:hypothetical protein